jgi:hypothetical protein
MVLKRGNKRGQLTIFIILAILIVGVLVAFFMLKKEPAGAKVPQEFDPVYNQFLSCMEEDVRAGIEALEIQGGHIYLPEYEPGSRAYPFSSQLSFVGASIPYWYYVSGSGFQKSRVPSVEDMQSDLEKFLESRTPKCNFDTYYEQGISLILGEPKVKINIKDDKVILDLDMDFVAYKGEDRIVVKNHKIIVDSWLGSLYSSALKTYSYEQENLFLEKYGIDILNLYAPVNGVEFTCSPKIWEANAVFNDLEEAIELNTRALRSSKEIDYFSVDIPVDEGVNVRFINSRNWTRSFEVNPSKENIMMANPIGNQMGLGILGFCYVTYHFVYNVNYPVLVQVYKGDEIFQFPLAVVIRGNKEREPMEGTAFESEELELCKDKNTPTRVGVYNKEGQPVEANISFTCFEQRCNIGETAGGILTEYFPQCVNGFIIARADGYRENSLMYTSVNSGQVSLFLDKLYTLNLLLRVDGTKYNGNALVNFVSDDFSESVSYPSQTQVDLSRGDYEIQVYVYRNSSLKLPETTIQQCVEVPRGTFGGFFGLTKKECFDVEYPSQLITNALSAGGKQEYSIEEDYLKKSKTIEINVQSFPSPTTLQQIQENYNLFEQRGVEVRFV